MNARIAGMLFVALMVSGAHATLLDPQAEWEAYREAAATESVEEAIEQLDGPFPATQMQRMQIGMRRGDPAEAAVELLADDPRMQALRRGIARSEPDRRIELEALVIAKLKEVFAARQALDEVPAPGEAPSGIPLITLVVQYDRTGASLPVLLAWFEAEGPDEDDPGIVDGGDAQLAIAAIHAILKRLGDAEPVTDFAGSIRAMRFSVPPMASWPAILAEAREVSESVDE